MESKQSQAEEGNKNGSEEIERFRQFLRIPTISFDGPKGPYKKAAQFLAALLAKFCSVKVIECAKDKPIVIGTVQGTNPKLKSIILNSHYDVVPCVLDKWKCNPFDAILESGFIVARGTQDMKCVCMQYIEALMRLTKLGQRFLRTIHLVFVPDEEIGGVDGMGKFVHTPEFGKLNAGVALDEGLANEGNAFTVFYGERAVWWVKIRARGPTGHGSRFIDGTAMEKLIKVINSLLDFREEQRKKLHEGCRHAQALKLGDVATLNLTMLEGGVKGDNGKFALNVIPTEACAGFDIRLPPTLPLDKFEDMLKEWTRQEGVSYEFVYKTPSHYVSSIDRKQCPFWGAFEDCFEKEMKKILEKEIFPAGTDGRYIRAAGIPVYGFSPMANTKIMLHDHNEALSTRVFLQGIEVYEKLIPALANVPRGIDDNREAVENALNDEQRRSGE
mmetsp:Transcript_18959/g.46551  ORF Transcript_18959/g.46551 Transcript_18959/m.46551 type:complete len:444 (-) Transcript_18959:135-1466(-)